MSARELSARIRDGHGVSMGELQGLRASLSSEQLERIRAKQQWEGCSFLAVLADWPSLFEDTGGAER